MFRVKKILKCSLVHLNFYLSCCQITLGIQENITLHCIFLLALSYWAFFTHVFISSIFDNLNIMNKYNHTVHNKPIPVSHLFCWSVKRSAYLPQVTWLSQSESLNHRHWPLHGILHLNIVKRNNTLEYNLLPVMQIYSCIHNKWWDWEYQWFICF